MKIEISLLKPNPYSEGIYDSTPSDELIESIRKYSVITPIWITKDNLIIAGHRRVNACKKLGIQEIPYEYHPYSESLVIESNRYRNKTWDEKLNEAVAVEVIEEKKAKERQAEGGRNKVVQNSTQPKTRDIVAEKLDTSHDTLSKIKFIKKENPELFEMKTLKSTILAKNNNVEVTIKLEVKTETLTRENLENELSVFQVDIMRFLRQDFPMDSIFLK